jgi:hypothetical protein
MMQPGWYPGPTILVIITLWPEMNINIFISLLLSFMTVLFTGLQVKGREQRGKE